ncbi:hypothetical protein PLICRDRAFT_564998 [Plicaturopsis crispa FD-325 SS-3]|nr:hypothetical protein PLICRDRAFT_564998 [Plicaturopsis crispa FD-325 SS-3]
MVLCPPRGSHMVSLVLKCTYYNPLPCTHSATPCISPLPFSTVLDMCKVLRCSRCIVLGPRMEHHCNPDIVIHIAIPDEHRVATIFKSSSFPRYASCSSDNCNPCRRRRSLKHGTGLRADDVAQEASGGDFLMDTHILCIRKTCIDTRIDTPPCASKVGGGPVPQRLWANTRGPYAASTPSAH